MSTEEAQQEILMAENVASEVIRAMWEAGEISKHQVKVLLEWSGDSEYVSVEDIVGSVL